MIPGNIGSNHFDGRSMDWIWGWGGGNKTALKTVIRNVLGFTKL